MPVFDFKDKPDSNESICTYITFKSWSNTASAENPIMVIANPDNKFTHHTNGMFINPIKRTSFELHNDSEKASYDIVRIDSRFTSLYKWLGENHIKSGFPVYSPMRATACTKSANKPFLIIQSFLPVTDFYNT